MRDAIAKIPDGDYVGNAALDADGFDKDEQYGIQVTLKKRGSSIEADLSGTSRQAQTCINASFIDTKNTIGCALSMLLAPGIPFTSGNWRNIDVLCPPGSVASALPPDGAVMFYWESGAAVLASVFKALNPLLGPDAMAGDSGSSNAHTASGLRPDGTGWGTASQVGGENGPWGATKVGDGDSYVVPLLINALIPGLEPAEVAVPMAVLANTIVPDSGGPGRHRGGAALRRETVWFADGEHYMTPLRTRDRAGFGAYGGRDGRCGAIWTFPPEVAQVRERGAAVPLDDSVYASSIPIGGVLDPETKCLSEDDGYYFHYASQPSWKLAAGSVLRVVTNAAGGWGDPYTRDVEAVVLDVRNGYVSLEGAERDYGVVIHGDPHFDPEGLSVDVEATERLREGHEVQQDALT
jgi:N-methylhydantoinase B